MNRNLHQYDPSGYNYDGSYRRMSIDCDELYWDGKQWITFEEKARLEKIEKDYEDIMGKPFDIGKWFMWTMLFLSIAMLLFMCYIFIFK